MKTFSAYLLVLCVYWSSRAASGKSRGVFSFLFVFLGGSFDVVELNRICLFVCTCVYVSLLPV